MKSFPPSTCPKWCTEAHHTPNLGHSRDLGVVAGEGFEVTLSLFGDDERDMVRLSIDAEESYCVELSEDMALGSETLRIVA
ncbi:hypothetical protein Aph01nite_08280 [Acrocarpospora phusangensis]|uniref:Uncharacterized protein n=1 Tax=Acrocarpospora phusangensis TaxID=1070424 RepID=A0A919ULQ6_9ACTN|nr:hypothetical protein Aph01nite_08280 [Acrocarpospora phusangensis]